MIVSALTSSFSGMTAAAKRLEVAASNIANATSTGPLSGANGEGGVYQPLAVVQSEGPGGVRASVVPRTPATIVQADPGSPDADERGLVAAPAVDMASELIDVLQARIGYEASAKVMSVARDMAKTTLDTLA